MQAQSEKKRPDDACAARRFIRSTGRLLFRRPLSPEAKVADFVTKAHAASTNLKDFYAGLSGVLEGMLVDPELLMIVDTTEPDPETSRASAVSTPIHWPRGFRSSCGIPRPTMRC